MPHRPRGAAHTARTRTGAAKRSRARRCAPPLTAVNEEYLYTPGGSLRALAAAPASVPGAPSPPPPRRVEPFGLQRQGFDGDGRAFLNMLLPAIGDFPGGDASSIPPSQRAQVLADVAEILGAEGAALVRPTLQRVFDSVDVAQGRPALGRSGACTNRISQSTDVCRCTASMRGSSCAVCCEVLQGRQNVRKLPCGHFFHPRCVDTWLRLRATCPTCREELPPLDMADHEHEDADSDDDEVDGMMESSD